jgi:hypothetical protein
VNTCYYLLDYLVSVAKKKPDEKSEIVVGGIITFIARKMGVGEENGITRIEGNNRLDLDTLTTMFFIRPYGSTHNYQYEWKFNRAHCLIILPNQAITNPGWWKICFMLVLTHMYKMMVMMVMMRMRRCTLA